MLSRDLVRYNPSGSRNNCDSNTTTNRGNFGSRLVNPITGFTYALETVQNGLILANIFQINPKDWLSFVLKQLKVSNEAVSLQNLNDGNLHLTDGNIHLLMLGFDAIT